MFTGGLRKYRQRRGFFHLLQPLVVNQLLHKSSKDIRHWYDERRTLKDGSDDLFDCKFRLYETGQLRFVKGPTLAGTDDFCQGMFDYIERPRLDSFFISVWKNFSE